MLQRHACVAGRNCRGLLVAPAATATDNLQEDLRADISMRNDKIQWIKN